VEPQQARQDQTRQSAGRNIDTSRAVLARGRAFGRSSIRVHRNADRCASTFQFSRWWVPRDRFASNKSDGYSMILWVAASTPHHRWSRGMHRRRRLERLVVDSRLITELDWACWHPLPVSCPSVSAGYKSPAYSQSRSRALGDIGQMSCAPEGFAGIASRCVRDQTTISTSASTSAPIGLPFRLRQANAVRTPSGIGVTRSRDETSRKLRVGSPTSHSST